MKVYIKENLRDIPIFGNMYRLIKAYSEKYGSEAEIDSWEDYRYSLNSDNVKRFLDYVIPDTVEDKKERVSYLTNLFYLTKGTYKVLDYLLDYDLFGTTGDEEGLDSTTEISYSARTIVINIKKIPSRFEYDTFCEFLEKFLCTLLYFESLTIVIESHETMLEDTTISSLNHGEIFYQYYEVEEKDDI